MEISLYGRLLPAQAEIVVGEDVKKIGLESFGGLFPPKIEVLKAGLNLVRGQWYKFEEGTSEVGVATLSNWLDASKDNLGVDYTKSIYEAQIDFTIPKETKDILSIPHINMILAASRYGD